MASSIIWILNNFTEVNRRVAGLKTQENASLESLKSLEKRIGSMLKRAEKSIKSLPCDKDINKLRELLPQIRQDWLVVRRAYASRYSKLYELCSSI